MEGPEQITPKTPGDYLEVLTKAVFQAGISWRVIASKWDGFREAFHGFDAHKVASLTPKDVDRFANDTRIVRNRSKIEATIANAETILALEEEFGSFKRYLHSHGDFESTVSDLRKRFKWLGDSGAYYFLHVVKEPVPPHDEWMAGPSAASSEASRIWNGQVSRGDLSTGSNLGLWSPYLATSANRFSPTASVQGRGREPRRPRAAT